MSTSRAYSAPNVTSQQARFVCHGETMNIELAVTDDIDELLRLERTVFSMGTYSAHQFERRQFARYINLDRAAVLVARCHSEIAGNVIVIAGSGSRSHVGRVLSIAVANQHRNRGVGKQLIDAAMHWFRHHGCRRISLEVASSKGRAQALFRRSGFEKTRHLPNYYGPDEDGVRMKRCL